MSALLLIGAGVDVAEAIAGAALISVVILELDGLAISADLKVAGRDEGLPSADTSPATISEPEKLAEDSLLLIDKL